MGGVHWGCACHDFIVRKTEVLRRAFFLRGKAYVAGAPNGDKGDAESETRFPKSFRRAEPTLGGYPPNRNSRQANLAGNEVSVVQTFSEGKRNSWETGTGGQGEPTQEQ